jgi:hypothetical protein
MLRWSLACVIALAMSLMPRSGLCDGFMVARRELGRSSRAVASPKQEAILATDGRAVQVVLRTHFRRGPKELAWVVPVPGRPTGIDRRDETVFALLERETAPRFYRTEHRSHFLPFSCGCATGAGGPVQVSVQRVVVEEIGTAGIFAYAVLSATDPEALTRWLKDHEYVLPERAEPVLKHYVQAGWYWLAMRIRPEIRDKAALAPHPVTYVYQDRRLLYPLVISQLSADLENEIVLYVVGSARYACSNWTNAAISDWHGELKQDSEGPSGTNYEKLLRDAAGGCGKHLFVTELAERRLLSADAPGAGGAVRAVLDGALLAALGSSPHVTRLRAVVQPEAMDRDVMLVPTDWAEVSNVVDLGAVRFAPARAGVAVPLAPLGGLGVGVALRLRRLRRRR